MWWIALTILIVESLPVYLPEDSGNACGEFGLCNCSDEGVVDCKDRQLSKLPKNIPTKTRFLYLNGNNITHIPPSFMLQFPVLLVLNVGWNQIKEDFKLPPCLREFFCSNNKLTALDGFFPDGCFRLSKVYFKENLVTDVHQRIFKDECKHLKKLRLDGNSIRHISNETLSGLTKLQFLYLRHNNITTIGAGAFSDVCHSLVAICLGENRHLSSLPHGLFENCSSLNEVFLQGCNFKQIERRTFAGMKQMIKLVIIFNYNLRRISGEMFSGVQEVYSIIMGLCGILEVPETLFQNVSSLTEIDFGYNQLTTLPERLFWTQFEVKSILLHHNNISHLPPGIFRNLSKLTNVLLFGNRLVSLSTWMFMGTNLQYLYLFRNKLENISGESFKTGNISTLQQIDVRENPIVKFSHNSMTGLINATLTLNCDSVYLPNNTYGITLNCVSPKNNIVIEVSTCGEIWRAILRSGYTCSNIALPREKENIKCTACRPGAYGNGHRGGGCAPCPPGGFYQDEAGIVPKTPSDIPCKKCNPGTFVLAGGGNSSESCTVCPDGTDTKRHAGFRACFCLRNHYRMDRFGKCLVCPQKGLLCSGGWVKLKPGFYWNWSFSDVGLYQKFVENLNVFNNTYHREFSFYNGTLPMCHECPFKGSCVNNLSNIEGNCLEGYKGWLCTLCEDGFLKIFGHCKRCSAILVVSESLKIVSFSVFHLILGISLFNLQRNKMARSVGDMIISRVKIFLGFSPVLINFCYRTSTNGTSWYLHVQMFVYKIIQSFSFSFINLFQPFSCFFEWLKWNPHTQLKLFYILVGSFLVGMIAVHIAACYKSLKTRPEVAGDSYTYEYPGEKAPSWKTVLAIAVFVTYPESCRIAFQLFFCDAFYMDQSNTKSIDLLHVDYSIACDSEAHKSYKTLGLILLFYVLSFPIALLIFLKRKAKLDLNSEPKNSMWLYFVLENYKAECWYWEVMEQVRKLSLVAISLRFRSKGFAKILGLSTSVIFLAIHIHKKPFKRKTENRLQVMSLLLIHMTLIIGTEDFPNDTMGFVIFVLFIVNFLFVLYVAGGAVKAIPSLYRLCRADSSSYSAEEFESESEEKNTEEG